MQAFFYMTNANLELEPLIAHHSDICLNAIQLARMFTEHSSMFTERPSMLVKGFLHFLKIAFSSHPLDDKIQTFLNAHLIFAHFHSLICTA